MFKLRLPFILALLAGLLAQVSSAAEIDPASLKTFGTVGKQLTPLRTDREAELFQYSGKGCLTHMWFGGGWKGCEATRIRIYVDHETNASIDMELFLGHGIGFGDETAPWGIARMGKIGAGANVYDTYRIPFGSHIRVTAQLADGVTGQPLFWWIIRGTENLPVTLGGVKLPDQARLRLHKLVNYTAQPMEEFSLCTVPGNGALYQVTMAGKGLRTLPEAKDRWKDLSYMEGCMRAYIGGATNPLMLSSGLEDYFLGTYYFNRGRYATPVAGLTHFEPAKNEFSAYRLHDDDPVLYQGGLRLTCRCGEKLNGQMLHDCPQANYTTYVWLYEW
jgi:hypothetical protein